MPPLTDIQQDTHPNKNLRTAAEALKAAIDQSVIAANGNGDLGASCDNYTHTAKNFAKLILEQRIRQFCDGMHMQEISRASDSELLNRLDKKEAFAETIRDWLSPWNFGFRDPKHGGEYQLYAVSSGNEGATGGKFSLSQYGSSRAKEGSSRSPKKVNAWAEIVRVVADPDLEDVTSFFRRK